VEQHRLDHRLYDEVTRSLFYPDIFSRQEQVGHIFDGIENSYDWIFQEPRTREVGENNQDFNGTRYLSGTTLPHGSSQGKACTGSTEKLALESPH